MKRKVGIIGYGWVAGANHKNSYAQAKDVEIVAVCDVNKAALERAKRDYNLPDEALFDDYKKLIDSGLCDMVDICTPNSFHCEQAKYALNAGLPVSIEKPVGVNSQEVEEVRALAEEKGLPVFICFTWRHMPTTRFLKDVIDSGAVGKVYHCYIKCIKESGLWEGRRLEWRFQKELGGTGVLCDLGSHMIDFLNWMNEDIVGLTANTGIFIKERQKLDSNECGAVATTDGFTYKDAVSLAWVSERELLLFVQIIDKYFGNMSAHFYFKGDEVYAVFQKAAEHFLNEYQGVLLGQKRK